MICGRKRMDEYCVLCMREDISDCIIEESNVPKLIIIRGLPGSGKSEIANFLTKNEGIIHSTDNFFVINGVYEFNIEKLKYYHFLNFMNCLNSLKANISPIVIDNTNIMASHCRNYVDAAKTYGYNIEIIETQTPWRFDVDELVKRNIHGTTRESIESMLLNYEPIDLFKAKLGIR